MPTIKNLLDVPASWASSTGLKNFLFKPVDLGVKWLEYFNIPISATVVPILDHMKICSSFITGSAVFAKIHKVSKGPKPEDLYLIENQSVVKAETIKYQDYHVRAGSLYVGFTSDVMTFIKYLDGKVIDLSPLVRTLVGRSGTVAALIIGGLNLWAEWNLRKQLSDNKQMFSKEENYLSLSRIALNVFKITHVILKASPYAKARKFENLLLLTGLCGSSFFSHFYEKWVVEPMK